MHAITLLMLCAAALPGPLLITDEGVGSVRAGQVVDNRTLEKALPGCKVERHQRVNVPGSASVHTWWLSCGSTISSMGDKQIFIVHADVNRRVQGAAVYGPGAATKEGIAVGSRVAELKKLGALKCRLIPEEEMVALGCVALATPGLEFMFPALPGAETALRPLVHQPFAPDLQAEREIMIIEWTAQGTAR